MTTEKIFMMTIMVLYLISVIVIGIKSAKESSNSDDFYLGGRKLGPFVTAMSAEASDMSSWLLMGLPGVAYISGLADAFWTALGLALGTYINWLIVAKRIRCYSHKINAITIPDFFSKRFNDKTNILTLVSAIFIIVFFVPYTASGFAACGKLFNSLFGFDYHISMIVSAIVILGYTTLGGFLAASTTDFMQSIIMSIALIVVLVFGIISAGGITAVVSNAESLVGYISLTNIHNAESNTAQPYGIITIVSTLAWGLGYFGMPHILLRFMAIEDKDKLKISRRVATIWVFISLGVGVAIGIIGRAMSKSGSIAELTGSNSETIIVEISNRLSHYGFIAIILAGLILAGILASTMSTADSQLLAASSSVSEDILKRVFKIKIDDKTSLAVARLSIVMIAIVGIVIAWNKDSSVFKIVSFAWAGFGAVFGPSVLFALFCKRANVYGIFVGMLSGGIMVFVWKFLIRPFGGIVDIYELLPAFIVSSLLIFIVSLATPEPDTAVKNDFDSFRAELDNSSKI